MEGPVFPGQDSRIRAAPVLRPAAFHGGDQLHLLSHAECEDGHRLGRGDSSRIHVRPQGAAAHHAHRPAPGRGPPATLLPRNGTQAGPQARADPVSASAQFQKGSGPPERPAHAVPGGSAVCLGVPARVVVHGRRLRSAARRQRGAVRGGHGGGPYAARGDRRLRLHATARRGLQEEGSRALGQDGEGFGEGLGGCVHLLQARGVGDRAETGTGVHSPFRVSVAERTVPIALDPARARRVFALTRLPSARRLMQSLVWLMAASGVWQQPLPTAPPPEPPPGLTSARMALAPADTGQRRPRAIEYSNSYAVRLTIHRYASYATLPLFIAEYALGRSLYNTAPDRVSSSVRSAHGAVAVGIAALFGVNTVTGGWNLWDARKDPAGRTRRYVHAALMLVSDAGRSEEHTSELQSRLHLVCRLLLEKKKKRSQEHTSELQSRLHLVCPLPLAKKNFLSRFKHDYCLHELSNRMMTLNYAKSSLEYATH